MAFNSSVNTDVLPTSVVVCGTNGVATLILSIVATMSGGLRQLRITSWGAALGCAALQTPDGGV